MTPEALALAERHADADRALLASLRRSGRVVARPVAGYRDDGLRRGAVRFGREVEALAFPPRAVNLAIRPKKKGKRR